MQKDTFIEISSTLQCQKVPQGIRIRLESHFPQLETFKQTKNGISRRHI